LLRIWNPLDFGPLSFLVVHNLACSSYHTIMSHKKLTEFICVFTGLCQSSMIKITSVFLQFFIQSLTAQKKTIKSRKTELQKNFSSEPTNFH
jgi:hypothetical protein